MLHNSDNKLSFIGLPPSNPRLLIPMSSSKVQTLSFGLYSPSSSYGKLLKMLGEIAARVGLMRVAGRFVAAPPEMFKGTEAIQPILDNGVLSDLRVAWEGTIGKGLISIALSLGEPNHYRKVTALVFDKEAKPIAFAKVGSTSQSGKLIANECMALEKVNSLILQGAVIPELLGCGKVGFAFWLLQTTLLTGYASPSILQKEHLTFLADFSQATVQVMTLEASSLYKYLCRMLNKPILSIKASFESERPFILDLREWFRAANANGSNKPWFFAAAHGDFTPWNMRLLTGKISLFDWEYFLPSAPVGWDILYFIFQVENLIKGLSLEQIWVNFKAGLYDERLMLFEKDTGLNVPDRHFLASFVILAIALELVPQFICEEIKL